MATLAPTGIRCSSGNATPPQEISGKHIRIVRDREGGTDVVIRGQTHDIVRIFGASEAYGEGSRSGNCRSANQGPEPQLRLDSVTSPAAIKSKIRHDITPYLNYEF